MSVVTERDTAAGATAVVVSGGGGAAIIVRAAGGGGLCVGTISAVVAVWGRIVGESAFVSQRASVSV